MDWGKKWLVDFNAGKTELVSFDWSNNTDSIDVEMYLSVLEKKLQKQIYRTLGLLLSASLESLKCGQLKSFL